MGWIFVPGKVVGSGFVIFDMCFGSALACSIGRYPQKSAGRFVIRCRTVVVCDQTPLFPAYSTIVYLDAGYCSVYLVGFTPVRHICSELMLSLTPNEVFYIITRHEGWGVSKVFFAQPTSLFFLQILLPCICRSLGSGVENPPIA